MSVTDPYAAPDAPHIEEAKFTLPTAEPVAEAPAEPVTAELIIPEGSIKEVLEWVGEDDAKAQAVLDSGETRKTLVSKLHEILNK